MTKSKSAHEGLDTSKSMQGYLLALLAAVGTAAATIVGKWNLYHVTPTAMNACIFTVAAVLFTLTSFRGNRPGRASLTRTGWQLTGLFSLFSMAGIWFFWAGIQGMDPTLAAFLNRVEVIIAILLAVIFLRERFNVSEGFGALLSIAGIVIMRLTLRLEFTQGFWLVLTGALFSGINEFIAKHVVRHGPIQSIMWVRSTAMAVGFWILFLLRGESLAGLSTVWPGILALGFLGPVFARVAYMHALRRIPLSRAAVVVQAYPVFVLVLALAAFGQIPSLRELAGGLFIAAGCVVMILTRSSSARAT